MTGVGVKRAHVDRSYRSRGVEGDRLDIAVSHTRSMTSPTIRREMRR